MHCLLIGVGGSAHPKKCIITGNMTYPVSVHVKMNGECAWVTLRAFQAKKKADYWGFQQEMSWDVLSECIFQFNNLKEQSLNCS